MAIVDNASCQGYTNNLMKKIGILLGSTRQGRRSELVAKWLETIVVASGTAEAVMLDPKAAKLPFFDEPKGPDSLNRQYSSPELRAWSELVDSCQAFIILSPEYNHGYTGVLKNALDSLYPEWTNKPAGIVSYSPGNMAGVRAAEQLKQVLFHLNLVVVRPEINISKVDAAFDEAGKMTSDFYQKKATELVTVLSGY